MPIFHKTNKVFNLSCKAESTTDEVLTLSLPPHEWWLFRTWQLSKLITLTLNHFRDCAAPERLQKVAHSCEKVVMYHPGQSADPGQSAFLSPFNSHTILACIRRVTTRSDSLYYIKYRTRRHR
jgi:hypothetical protein